MHRRSPLLEAYAPSTFEIGSVHDTRIALRATEADVSAGYIVDLCAVRRRLFVGRHASQWLARYGIEAPQELLTYRDLGSGACIVRLHRDQYLLIDALDSSPYDELLRLPEGRQDDILVLAYEATEIGCGGAVFAATVAELCPMDLGAAAGNHWIATRFAHCEVALRRMALGSHWRILSTPADARHLFEVLHEVMRERGGSIIGFEDYRELVKHEERTS